MGKLVAFLVVAVSACGGLVESSANVGGHPDAGSSGAGGNEAGQAEAADDGGPGEDAAIGNDTGGSDSDQPCTPEPLKWNCCNGDVCRGMCDGPGCHCGELKGGCPPPLVCCATVCKAEGKC